MTESKVRIKLNKRYRLCRQTLRQILVGKRCTTSGLDCVALFQCLPTRCLCDYESSWRYPPSSGCSTDISENHMKSSIWNPEIFGLFFYWIVQWNLRTVCILSGVKIINYFASKNVFVSLSILDKCSLRFICSFFIYTIIMWRQNVVSSSLYLR